MIHYFNPGHEAAVLNNSPYYTPAANQCKMQHDLAYLPAWYAFPDDFVFVTEKPADDFIHFFAGQFSLPKVVSEVDFANVGAKFVNSEVSLWGLSPHSVHLFLRMSEKYDLALSVRDISSEYKKISGRHTALKGLKYLIETIPGIHTDILPIFFSDPEEIERFIADKEIPLLVKSPYSSSGRGLLWLPPGDMQRSEKQILSGMLKKQGEVSVEPVLNRIIDFSAQFVLLKSGNIDFLGFSLFQTTSKGAYIGNQVLSREKTEEIITSYIDKDLLIKVKEEIIRFMNDEISSGYCGNVGVDMMVYEKNGIYYLHPCVEINVRKNMGFLAMRLYENCLVEGKSGFFGIDFEKQPGIMAEKHLIMTEKHPCVFKNGRMDSGYISLCPIDERTKYRAYLIIE